MGMTITKFRTEIMPAIRAELKQAFDPESTEYTREDLQCVLQELQEVLDELQQEDHEQVQQVLLQLQALKRELEIEHSSLAQ